MDKFVTLPETGLATFELRLARVEKEHLDLLQAVRLDLQHTHQEGEFSLEVRGEAVGVLRLGRLGGKVDVPIEAGDVLQYVLVLEREVHLLEVELIDLLDGLFVIETTLQYLVVESGQVLFLQH